MWWLYLLFPLIFYLGVVIWRELSSLRRMAHYTAQSFQRVYYPLMGALAITFPSPDSPVDGMGALKDTVQRCMDENRPGIVLNDNINGAAMIILTDIKLI